VQFVTINGNCAEWKPINAASMESKKNKQAITLITLNKLTSYADYCSTKVVTLNNAVV